MPDATPTVALATDPTTSVVTWEACVSREDQSICITASLSWVRSNLVRTPFSHLVKLLTYPGIAAVKICMELASSGTTKKMIPPTIKNTTIKESRTQTPRPQRCQILEFFRFKKPKMRSSKSFSNTLSTKATAMPIKKGLNREKSAFKMEPACSRWKTT